LRQEELTEEEKKKQEEKIHAEYEEIQERSEREAEGNMRECGQDAGGGDDEVGGKKEECLNRPEV
jgi:hypothetical protein